MDLNTFMGAFVLGFSCCGVITMIIDGWINTRSGHIEPSKPWPRSVSNEKPIEKPSGNAPLPPGRNY